MCFLSSVKIFADGALVILLDYLDNNGIVWLNGFLQYFISGMGLFQGSLVVFHFIPDLIGCGRGYVFIFAQKMQRLANTGGHYSLHGVSPPSVCLSRQAWDDENKGSSGPRYAPLICCTLILAFYLGKNQRGILF